MKRFRLLWITSLMVLLIALIFSACAPAAQNSAEPTQPADVPPSPELPAATTEPQPTESPSAAVTLVDALGREVVFDEVPQRIVVAGRATQLLVDSIYLFPEASERVVGIEQRLQSRDFVQAVDLTEGDITYLERDAGAEQIAPLNPDVVVMKTYMNETIGAGLEQIDIPVVYLELETLEQFALKGF